MSNKPWIDSKVYQEFSAWRDLVTDDLKPEFYKVYLKSFRLSNMGKQAVVPFKRT